MGIRAGNMDVTTGTGIYTKLTFSLLLSTRYVGLTIEPETVTKHMAAFWKLRVVSGVKRAERWS